MPYISPNWYPTKKETGKVVPTWNYLAIHAYGKISFYHDVSKLKDHVSALLDRHEEGMPEPWAISDAPAEYIDTMLQRIVGFELTVTRIEGKWKMSQNREAKDAKGAREGLLGEGGEQRKAVAEAMAKSG
jgi:transcriptional regulator